MLRLATSRVQAACDMKRWGYRCLQHTSESCSTRSLAACTIGVKSAGPRNVALCSAFLEAPTPLVSSACSLEVPHLFENVLQHACEQSG